MSTIPNAFGVYFWAGYDVPNALVPGLQILQQVGFETSARIRLTPAVRPKSLTDRGEYRFDEQWEREVPTTAPFLPAAVRSTQYQRAFSLSRLRTFVFQAYDSASTGSLGEQRNHRDLDWLNRNAERVRNEYRDMTVALYETQNGTGKQFIVSNWETDNEIYFKEDPPFASASKHLTGLRRWFQLRQEGIRQGREIATQHGWRGIEVNDAVEFNNFSFHNAYQSCFSSGFIGDTLNTIITEVKPDYASFSAWESMGRGRLYDDLISIKNFLYTATHGHTRLIIGELGVTGHSHPNFPQTAETLQTKAWKYVNLAHAALRADIPVIILWKGWDYFGQFEGEGLLDENGKERPILRSLRDSFGGAIMITGVVDQFDMYGWRAPDKNRYFEVYGTFPEANTGNVTNSTWIGNYEAIFDFSDGQTIVHDTWGEGISQINISLAPDVRLVKWFNLRLRRKRDGLTTPQFGPLRLNRFAPDSIDCKVRVEQRYWDNWAPQISPSAVREPQPSEYPYAQAARIGSSAVREQPQPSEYPYAQAARIGPSAVREQPQPSEYPYAQAARIGPSAVREQPQPSEYCERARENREDRTI